MDVLVKYVAIAWSAVFFAFGSEWMQTTCLLLFMIAGLLSSKHTVGVVCLYYFIVLVPVFFASYAYSSSIRYSLTLFIVPFLLNASLVSFALTRSNRFKPFALVLVITILSVPPLASISIVSPVPLAGQLFPGFGVLGIVFFMLLCGLVSVVKPVSRFIPILIGLVVSQTTVASTEFESIKGIDTANGMQSVQQQSVEFYLNRYSQLEIAESSGVSTVVFPESAFGEWNDETMAIFEQADVTILGGARIQVDNNSYVNAIVNGSTGEIVYQQEKPIPFQVSGRMKSVQGNNTSNNYPAALICNEIVNPWRALDVFSTDKDTVIWIANLGWTDLQFIKHRLVSNVNHWSRLFNKKAVMAVNSHG